MQKCVNCGHENRPGVMYCENCGVGLGGQVPLETKSINDSSGEEKAQIGIEESVLIDVRVQGSGLFGENDLLRLDIEGSAEPIVLKPDAETIFGRRDPATGAMPDVDLTPFAGYRMGVSRRHAAIRFGDGQILNLWDLGSSNGTYLNGERLNAHRPYRLHDGDELRLGQMMIRVHFQSPAAEPPPDKKEEKAVQPDGKEEKPSTIIAPVPPVKPEAKAEEKPVVSAEKPKPPEAVKPIEPGPPKAPPDKPAAPAEPPADQVDGIITLPPPITDVFQRPEIKPEGQIEKPEEKSEKPEIPITKPISDEQLVELNEKAQQKEEKDQEKKVSDEEKKSDAAVPPVKPADEWQNSTPQDKEKRD